MTKQVCYSAISMLATLAVALGSFGCRTKEEGSFTLEIGRLDLQIVQGHTRAISVKLHPDARFSAPVKVTVDGLPSGIKADPLTLTPASPAGFLTFTASSTAPIAKTRSVILGQRRQLISRNLLAVSVLPTLTYTVDPGITPKAAARQGRGNTTKPVAAVKDSTGTISTFFADEIVVRPKTLAALASFVARYSGKVISSNAVRTPPASLGIKLEPKQQEATTYVVEIDAKSFNVIPGSFSADAAKVGVGGESSFSSDLAMRLLALTAHERSDELIASPNFIDEGTQSILTTTQERPDGSGGFVDAYGTAQFHGPSVSGSKASVVGAWEFMAARSSSLPQVKVAIIDGGFWLNESNGVTQQVPAVGTDIPLLVAQDDLKDDDTFAGGPNPMECTGGSPCPWHGNGSVSVAVGMLNNRHAAAGTGGQVGVPMLFRFDGSHSEASTAVRTATAWGAQVISMSFGSNCNYWCRNFDDYDDDTFSDAVAKGVVLVASAGNDSNDVGDPNYYHPCLMNGVICVGALADSANTSMGYSNFGAGVDIWAPTDIPVMPDPDNMDPANPPIHTGTSAAAPFVAGVAAMMKSLNPGLNSDDIRNIMVNTGWKDSTDSKVTAYLNALAAVETAGSFALGADYLEPNDDPNNPRDVPPGNWDLLTIANRNDMDYYRITVGSRSQVDFNFTFPGELGRILVGDGLQRLDSCGSYGLVNETSDTNTYGYQVQQVPSGHYLLPVSAGRPTIYKMNLKISGIAIPNDSYDHRGLLHSIRNDTFESAAPLGNGALSAQATIDPATDVDFYSFHSSGSFFNKMLGGFDSYFGITSSDGPLTLTLYSAADKNTVLNTSVGSPDCSSLPRFDRLAAGDFVVKVESPSSTRGIYTFSVGRHVVQGTGGIAKWKPGWIDPGDPPYDGWLIDPADYFVFGPKVNQERQRGELNAVRLTGAGVHLALLDTEGKQLLGGQVSSDANRTKGETISLRDTRPDQTYVIRVSRNISEQAAEKQIGKLPGLRYTLQLN